MSERNPKMSFDEIMQLLKSYRENECLWNHAHCNYRNQPERSQAFYNMLLDTNVATVEELKRRIKILRDTYNIEKNKMRRSRLSGPPFYNTKIPWYQTADEFLSKCDGSSQGNTNNASTPVCKSESSNYHTDRASSPESQENDSTDPLWENEGVYVGNFGNEEQSSSSSTGRKRSSESASASAPGPAKKVLRPSKQPHHANGGNSWRGDESGPSHVDPIRNKRQSINSSIAQPVQDEFLYFGLNLAAQLGELPKLRALLLQEKLQTLVSQERIEFEMSKRKHNDDV